MATTFIARAACISEWRQWRGYQHLRLQMLFATFTWAKHTKKGCSVSSQIIYVMRTKTTVTVSSVNKEKINVAMIIKSFLTDEYDHEGWYGCVQHADVMQMAGT